MEKPVVFKCDGEQLIGILHKPSATRGKKVPGMVLLHGFTGNRSEAHRLFVKMSRALAEIGIASLRFDFRGSGDSEGEFSSMTVEREVQDALAALRFLRRQKGIDMARSGILGFSFGGMVASLALSRMSNIKACALWAPVAHFDKLAEAKMRPEDRKMLKEMGCVDYGGWAVGKKLLDTCGSLEPVSMLSHAKVPTLLVHGELDQSDSVSASREYEAALKKAGVEHSFQLIKEADHTFASLKWEMEVIAITLEWFRCRLFNGCQ